MAKVSYKNEVKTKEGWTLSIDMIRLTFRLKSNGEQLSLINTLDNNKLLDGVKIADKNKTYKKIGDGLAVQTGGGDDEPDSLKPWEIKEYDPTMPLMVVNVYTQMCGFGKYNKLYTIHPKHDMDTTITLGIGLLNDRSTQLDGFLEFNPNKTYGEELEWLLRYLNAHCQLIEIKRYDIALDIPVMPRDVSLHRDNRKYALQSPSAENRNHDTEYLGVRNTPGFFKKYNKAYEREQASQQYKRKHPDLEEPGTEIQGELTRLELTAETLDYKEFIKQFPKCDLKHQEKQASLTPMIEHIEKKSQLSQNDRVLLELLESSPDKDRYFKALTYRKRQVLEPVLYGIFDTPITIDEKDFNAVVGNMMQMCHVKNTLKTDIEKFFREHPELVNERKED